MIWHHRMCKFAHHPHPNILPAMPRPRTEKAAVTDIVKENLEQEGGATLWSSTWILTNIFLNFDKKNIVNLNRKALNRRGELQTLDGVFSTVRQVKSSLGGSHARQLDLLKYKILFYKESHLISGKICNIRFNHWQRFQLNYQQDWVMGGRVF